MTDRVTYLAATDGSTYYMLVFRPSDATVRDVVAGAWDTWLDADIDDYDTAQLAAVGAAGVVQFTFPTLSAGLYGVQIREQAGASPATSDSIQSDGVGLVAWDGTQIVSVDGLALASIATEARLAELDAANLPADIAAILADTGTDGVVLATDAVDADALAADAVTEIQSGLSTLTAAQVWSYATRTLTSFGTLVADVWSYATRTLTQAAAQAASILSGTTITLHRGDDLSVSITGLGVLTGYTNIWFTAKRNRKTDSDADALIQIDTATGLLRVNKAAVTTSTNGSISVDDATAGDITVTLTAAEAAKLDVQTGGHYDVQVKDASGGISTKTSGSFNVSADVTRATS